jgi:ribonuclease P protein component
VGRPATLRGRGAFDRVFSLGRRIDGDLLQCFFIAQPGEGIAAGFAVSSKRFNAVRRNRLRRLMRVAFARERSVLVPPLGRNRMSASIVFVFRPAKNVVGARLRLEPVQKDIAAICGKIAARL